MFAPSFAVVAFIRDVISALLLFLTAYRGLTKITLHNQKAVKNVETAKPVVSECR